MSEIDDLKKTACEAIDRAADELYQMSNEIWENPETAYKEVKAHDCVARFLNDKFGFPEVVRNFHLPTALKAEYGEKKAGGIHIACLSEYDALPEIGHACGHNLIAEVGVAAGVGIKAVIEKASLPCKVSVIGTPAEEHDGGKIHLINHGVFNNVDIAMMAHPSKYALTKPNYVAVKELNITFTGVESHAAEWPWEGVNALDAAVLCYNNVSCLRQQMHPDWMVHGIITHGGARPNIIPGKTSMEYYVRSATDPGLYKLEAKVKSCAQAAATATGCQIEITESQPYRTLLSNKTLLQLFETNGSSLGTVFESREEITKKLGGSTDMGNVSHVVPSIHPEFYIGTDFNSHTQEFTPAAGAKAAQSYTLDTAKALAMTAVDVMMDKAKLMPQIRKDFEHDLQMEKERN
ncbi:hypothetical protein FSP39_012538 [Pinctada imbricata]|uniref:Peptidase M20 domain-containing protein 2 n=1 Tax=Pinctada imbricata TaxID=66713 RepID=A0AA89BQR4_PINIB|nr:hypothetical protein FSP39_012538 [Pinctada imbricata]